MIGYYKNISGETKIIAVLSDSKTSVSHMSLAAGSIIEVSTSLDSYVPHILAKLDGNGRDISSEVIREREAKRVKKIEVAPEEVKPEVKSEEKPIEVSKPEITVETKTQEPPVETPKPEIKTPKHPGRPTKRA